MPNWYSAIPEALTIPDAIAQSKNNYARDGPSSPTQTSLSLAAGAFSAPAFPPVAPPRNFDVCRSLLLQLVAQRNSIPRRIINHITEEDAQSTIDFLDKVLKNFIIDFVLSPQQPKVLDNGKDLGIDESKRILHFLESIAKLFQVFPARCKLKDLQFDPSKPLYEGGYGYVCRGIYRNISVCVKVVRLCQQPSDNVTNLKVSLYYVSIFCSTVLIVAGTSKGVRPLGSLIAPKHRPLLWYSSF
jgi:hypothetical protein